MEIKDAEKTIDQADSFLTKLKTLLKKHWGILLILSIGYFFYWAATTDFPEEVGAGHNVEDTHKIEEVISAPEHEATYTITKKTYAIDKGGYRMGDTIYIDYYSDGYVDKYYTDGETFYE